MDSIEHNRILRAVVGLAERRGFRGDPFARYVPSAGSDRQELAILNLRLDVNCGPVSEAGRQFIKRLVRSIVLTDSGQQPSAVGPADDLPDDTVARDLRRLERAKGRRHG